EPARVAAAVRRLLDLALAWGQVVDGTPTTDAVSVAATAREAGGMFPAGLGRPAPELDGKDLPAMLAELTDGERRLLDTLAHGSPVGRTRGAATVVPLSRAETPVQRLLARGLLLRRDAETGELPRQVGLAIRGDHPLGTVELTEPRLPTTSRDPSTVDATGA